MEKDDTSFTHLNADGQFQSRSDAIFSNLANLEKKHEKEIPVEDPFAENFEGGRRGKRVPSRVPEHVLKPDKWKKYSLEEDGTGSSHHHHQGRENKSGDSLNEKIATDFLQELSERKRLNVQVNDKSDVDSKKMDMEEEKIVFHKPSSLKRKRDKVEMDEERGHDDDDENIVGQAGKFFTMKTYEFGQERKEGDKKSKDNATEKKEMPEKELALGHLDEKDEEIMNTEGEGKSAEHVGEQTKFQGHRKIKRNIRKTNLEDDPDMPT
eukprot:gene16999-18711_t